METISEFTHFDAFLLVLTEIVLPTTDVITDLLLIFQLHKPTDGYCVNNCFNYATFGKLMIIPLILSTFLLIPHWWQREKSNKQKLLTGPLVLFQCWPQYRALRTLWLKYKKENVQVAIQEVAVIKGTIGNIEPFVESIPQVHFTLVLFFMTMNQPNNGLDIGMSIDSIFFYICFFTSIVSGSFGLSKIIRNGPAKFISKTTKNTILVKVTGHLLLFLTIALSLVGKATWLGTTMLSIQLDNLGTGSAYMYDIVTKWIYLFLLPPFAFAILIFVWDFGFISAFKFLKNWPSYVLLPTFTPFTFSGIWIKGQKHVVLSYNWTWFNFTFSACCIVLVPFVYWIRNQSVYSNELSWDIGQIAWGATCSASLVYLGSYASFGLLTKLQGGTYIQRTAFNLDTFEEVQVDLDSEVEMINSACQATTLISEQSNDSKECSTVIQVWKEVACQTEPKEGWKKKSMELLSAVDFMEAFN